MRSSLIVMDEPTSALSSTEVEKLFRIIRDLKAEGLAIIFVTHRLEEVMRSATDIRSCGTADRLALGLSPRRP